MERWEERGFGVEAAEMASKGESLPLRWDRALLGYIVYMCNVLVRE